MNEKGSFLMEYAIIFLLVAVVVVIAVSALFAEAGPLGDILPNMLGL